MFDTSKTIVYDTAADGSKDETVYLVAVRDGDKFRVIVRMEELERQIIINRIKKLLGR